MRIEPGTHLGEYEVLALLAAGGMGEVYRARDVRLRREVAIKVITASMSSEADAIARFRREAEAASALNHPHIVTVHGFGETTLPDGAHVTYMVEELIEGRTLRALMLDKAVPRRELLRYCAQVAEGLSKAHAAGIIHRDLKPDNVMVSSDGYAKILDFGLAKLHEPNTTPKPNDATEKLRSESGAVIGTLGYMSPEQVRGRKADARSDIFSFGCILYEALSGQRPFTGDSQFDVLSNIVYTEAAPLTDVPEDLQRIVRRCLDKNPEERYQSARDLAIDLRERETTSTRVPVIAERRSMRPALLLIPIVILIGLFFITRRAPHPAIDSIVILPFTNVSRDPNLEYLSDGITDGLLNDIARASNIRVIARTTAFRYRNTTKELPAIGKELGVDGIVAGQVRRSGEQLLVDAELVNAADGTRVWGRHYERSASDMLAVEREVLGELTAVLGGKTAAPRPSTENRVAYDLYLKGRYFWNKRTPETLTKALELFQQAIDADPTYARAYSGMADCYFALNQLGAVPRAQSCTRGFAAARRAAELDESLAEAHASLGYLDLACELELAQADREFRRAIELSPNLAQAHHWYGLYLTNLGRAKEGLPEIREAARLDPFSTQIAGNLAYATFHSGQLKEALRLADDALELDRNAPYPYHMRGYIALGSGDYPTAIRFLRMAVDKKLVVSLPFLAYAYARSGDAAGARRVLAEIDASASDAARTPALRAGTLAALGDHAGAIAALQRAWEERDFWLSELHVSPPFEPLRSDPEFLELQKRVDAR